MDPISKLMGAMRIADYAEAEAACSEIVWKSNDVDFFEPLHRAAQMGDVELLKIILDGGGASLLEEFDDLSFTPLIWAAKSGSIKAVSFLVERGAQINLCEEAKIGNTALREVIDVCSFEMVEALLAAGADPNIPGWMQLTARQVAELRYGKQPNAENKQVLGAVGGRSL